MIEKQIKTLSIEVSERFLPFVRQPSRYIGGEVNQVRKKLDKCDLKIALCFPDVYEVGMSHTGLAILYAILNSIENIAAERAFCPWLDAEQVLRDAKLPLFSLESRLALKDFDVVGFSLSSELCYSNVLNMLDMAGIDIHSKNRTENDPLIIAGGSMAHCCEPMAEFIDLFVIGQAEQAVVELSQMIIELKEKGLSKPEILIEAAKQFPWAYAPCLYEPVYKNDKLTGIKPLIDGISVDREMGVIDDFDSAPVNTTPIVPFTEAVHERISIEIMRGCPGRCRFCQASFCRRPISYRSVNRIMEIAKASHEATGFDTISLLSLSTADYPELKELISRLNDYFNDKHVGISVPSLRVDSQLKLLPKLVTSVRKSGLTIAVESASEHLRKAINKHLKDVDLFAAVEAAYQQGYQKMKLYFMAGLPGETEEDIARIVELSSELALLRKRVDGKTANINVAISFFVPKPHTPFAWLGQNSLDYFRNAKDIILAKKSELRCRYLRFKFHDPASSVLECVIGRGDRRLGKIIETAWRNGARYDLWDESFDLSIWQKAFDQCGYDMGQLATRQYDSKDTLPWGHLAGPDQEYLLKHLSETMNSLISSQNRF